MVLLLLRSRSRDKPRSYGFDRSRALRGNAGIDAPRHCGRRASCQAFPRGALERSKSRRRVTSGKPHSLGLLPVPGRSRASALLHLAGKRRRGARRWRNEYSCCPAGRSRIAARPTACGRSRTVTCRGAFDSAEGVGARLPAIWRAAAANPDAALYQAYRVRWFCCRFPADRGQARSYICRSFPRFAW